MDSVFFWLSKLAWLIIAPDSLLLVLVLVTWALLWRGKNRMAKRMLGLVAIVMLIVAFFPVGEWILYPLEKQFSANPALPQRIDGIIVLSGAEDANLSTAWNQVELGDGAERLLAFQALARQYPGAKLVFTGGSGSMVNQTHKEADVAERLLKQQGLNASRVIFERESRNTFENVMLSKARVKPAVGENWILITSAFHMPRSAGIFCHAEWPVIPYPVDHRTWPGRLLRIDLNLSSHLGGMVTGIREWVGLAAYYATGKTAALLPPGCAGH
ncbi:MAG: YdcF family protein [Sulfuricella sp.]|nr:YdcF family protein [Sulfuricella sp.]